MTNVDGQVIIEINADPTKAEKKLMQLQKDIEELEAKLHQKTQEKTVIEQSLERMRNSLAKAEAEYTKNVIQEADKETLKEQEATIAAMAREVEHLESEFAKSGKECASLSAKLDKAQERAGELVKKIVEQREEERANSALGKAEQYMDSFVNRVKKLAKNVFIFSVITKALRALKSGLVSIIESNDETRESIAKLKGALLTLLAPINDVIVPAAKWLIDVLTALVAEIITIVSILSGKSVDEMRESARALYEESEALDAVGSSAKKAAGGLASFDTVTKLSSDSSISPNFDFADNEYLAKWADAFGKVNEVFQTIRSGIDVILDDIKFTPDSDSFLSSRASWEMAMRTLLGAALGSAFGGFGGGVIGAILGSLLSLYISGIDPDESRQPLDLYDIFIGVICGLIGAIVGVALLGMKGGLLGFGFGLLLSTYIADFAEGDQDKKSELLSELTSILCTLIGGIIGLKVGGIGGMIYGFLIGFGLSVIIDDFKEAEQGDKGALRNIFITVICTLVGAIVGAHFFGIGALPGAAIGFVLSLGIRLAIEKFEEGELGSITTLRESALRILKSILKSIFGVDLTVISSRASLLVQLPISLVLSFITQGMDTSAISNYAKAKNYAATQSSAAVQSVAPSYSVPALARGAVIPANRKFIAMLGDQRNGNNLEAPESLIRKIVREESGGANTELLQDILEAIKNGHVIVADRREIGRTAARGINDITISTGKSPLLI